jgi:hypothetical protein
MFPGPTSCESGTVAERPRRRRDGGRSCGSARSLSKFRRSVTLGPAAELGLGIMSQSSSRLACSCHCLRGSTTVTALVAAGPRTVGPCRLGPGPCSDCELQVHRSHWHAVTVTRPVPRPSRVRLRLVAASGPADHAGQQPRRRRPRQCKSRRQCQCCPGPGPGSVASLLAVALIQAFGDDNFRIMIGP